VPEDRNEAVKAFRDVIMSDNIFNSAVAAWDEDALACDACAEDAWAEEAFVINDVRAGKTVLLIVSLNVFTAVISTKLPEERLDCQSLIVFL